MQSSKPSQPAAPNRHLLAAVKGQVSPHSRTFPTFLKTTIFIFLKGWTRLIIFLKETSGTWWRVCLLHGGLLSWQLSITRVCSLLSWRRFESIGHNYQVVGLGGGEEHCRKKNNPYRWFQGEGMEEGTGIVRDKIIVWTSVNAPSSYYIDEGYHPQHLLFQMLFKSRMPQGAFCEHGDCVSVRCALTICLGEGCTGNLAFCIFRLHLVSLHGWAPCSWSRSRLARNQNSKFLECFPLERECFQLEREWLLNLGTSRAK